MTFHPLQELVRSRGVVETLGQHGQSPGGPVSINTQCCSMRRLKVGDCLQVKISS